jgi:hypothetical protein
MAIYILNPNPTKLVQMKKPEKAWSKRQPQVKQHRIFRHPTCTSDPIKTDR